MCDKAFSEDSFMLKYYLDRHKMYDEVVHDFLPTLKCISYWFVTSKIINKLYNA